MSTRGTYEIKKNGLSYVIYKHSDNYPWGAYVYLRRMAGGDIRNLYNMEDTEIFKNMLANKGHCTGLGFHSDIEYHYTVDLDKKEIEIYKIPFIPFEENRDPFDERVKLESFKDEVLTDFKEELNFYENELNKEAPRLPKEDLRNMVNYLTENISEAEKIEF
ncbi:hypothetical protein [Methanococcus voltae]|uniref:Uncharacterized protein n=1 Tax=Methanococcus voltae (strain ATCC BAA-1334 / A3) TaxID=456320 RepID=D7DS73_METV3|nr:hypothetical protein [Methanococcus voltae]MCS3901509.1 hypothetical protein [Methanococcus voltae]